MAFPATPLQVRVDLQLAGVWTDITSDALARDAISISRGRADEASRADPSTCKLSLKNQSGKYSARNPTSPYFGILGRNTPLRVGIGVPPVGTGTAGQVGTSVVAPSVNAEAAGALFCIWAAAPAGTFTAPGGFTAGTPRNGTLTSWLPAYKAVAAGATGTSTATYSTATTASAAMSVFVPGSFTFIRYSNINPGGSGLTLPITTVAAGDYMLVTYGWSSDPDNLMQNAPADTTGSAQWALIADTGPSAGPRVKTYMARVLAAGAPNIAFLGTTRNPVDVYGSVTVITGATDYYPRFTGEVSEWPPRWDLSGKDVWAPVQASGITRRLGQGAAPLRSALFRSIEATASLKAYWPMEDGAGSTSFASAVGGAPMTFLGLPGLAADEAFAASDALPTFTAAGAKGAVPSYPLTGTGQFLVGALVSVPAGGMTDQTTLLTVGTTAGTIATWTVKYATASGGTFRVQAVDSDGTSLLDSTIGAWAVPVTGSRFLLYLAVSQSGANVGWQLYYVPIVAGQTYPGGYAAPVTPTTVPILAAKAGRVSAVSVGKALDLTGAPTIGHVVVASDPAALFTSDLWHALVAWTGESAAERVRRLCQEESVPVYVPFPSVSELMGPQRPAALLTLLAECEGADGGVLYEPKGFIGLAFRPRASKQNQAAALTLSYSGGNISEPFEPTDDDQGVVNDVTANRVGGSSARARLDVGALSTLPPPAGVGRYDTSVDLNLFTDDQLPDQAAWRVHVGTWDETRYPSIHVDLAKNASLIGALTAADVGDLVTVTGLPAWLPPGPNDLILEGYGETLGHPIDWDVTGNYSPAGPYRVAVLNSGTYGRLDSLLSSLNAGITSTATSMAVKVTAGAALWTTTATRPTDLPFDVVVGGEVMTVTAIAGTSSPQTFTVTRSVNGVVKAQTVDTQVRLARPTFVGL